MTIAVIRAPRDVRASRAWKVGHYAVQPVTIRYPDGSVKVVHQEQAKPTAQKCSDIAEEVDPAVKRCRMVWQIYSLIKVHELQPLIAKVKFHGVISVYAAKFASEVCQRSCTFEVPKMF